MEHLQKGRGASQDSQKLSASVWKRNRECLQKDAVWATSSNGENIHVKEHNEEEEEERCLKRPLVYHWCVAWSSEDRPQEYSTKLYAFFITRSNTAYMIILRGNTAVHIRRQRFPRDFIDAYFGSADLTDFGTAARKNHFTRPGKNLAW